MSLSLLTLLRSLFCLGVLLLCIGMLVMAFSPRESGDGIDQLFAGGMIFGIGGFFVLVTGCIDDRIMYVNAIPWLYSVAVIMTGVITICATSVASSSTILGIDIGIGLVLIASGLFVILLVTSRHLGTHVVDGFVLRNGSALAPDPDPVDQAQQALARRMYELILGIPPPPR